MNSFGVGGANGHALLLSNKKVKNIIPDKMPRLICVSGVTESAVETMLNKVENLFFVPKIHQVQKKISPIFWLLQYREQKHNLGSKIWAIIFFC